MPFLETCQLEQRISMLRDYDLNVWSVTALCERYGVCRDTFYMWRARRAGGAKDWFADHSHAVAHCVHRTPEAVGDAVIKLRRRFPHFGPRKLRAFLERQQGDVAWPAASTIGDMLKREGLVTPERRRRRPVAQARTFTPAQAANDEWCVDVKGWFRTRDGARIDPLTISDAHSRYLIDVKIVAPTVAGMRPVFEAAFRACGLPLAIRCDNGSPFGGPGPAGLTRLSAWWLKLGVAPHFIHPASPQENGRHERMHRTLKRQTTAPAAATAAEQQGRFDVFRGHYNEERPHEALGQTPPAQCWSPSPRPLPEVVGDPWYDADHQVRRVRGSGEIKWRNGLIFLSAALIGELVGLAELDTGCHVVRFCDLDIGAIDRAGRFVRFAPPRPGLREADEPPGTQNPSTISPVQNVDYQSG